MDQFVTHYMLRLDAKGRVSVPASFRAVLARDGFDGLYCHPALDRPALDAGGNALITEIEALLTGFPPYSEEREQFSLALYGTSETLKIDGEGGGFGRVGGADEVVESGVGQDASEQPDIGLFIVDDENLAGMHGIRTNRGKFLREADPGCNLEWRGNRFERGIHEPEQSSRPGQIARGATLYSLRGFTRKGIMQR